EVTTARDALRAVEPYALVPAGLADMLEADAGPPARRRPTVSSVNGGKHLLTEGITTWLDGSDLPTAWTQLVDLDHHGDTDHHGETDHRSDKDRSDAADGAAGTVQQAFPPLRHVDPAHMAEAASTAAMPTGLHRQ